MGGSGADPDHRADPAGIEVWAGGGLVWRWGADGAIEILLVHRPRYDDWSFPKGKLDEGETLAECAVREVAEETGLRCTLGAELVDITYRDSRGRAKLVRYWVMTVDGGAFTPNDEVDLVAWVDPDGARDLLTYGHDQAVIDAASRHAPFT